MEGGITFRLLSLLTVGHCFGLVTYSRQDICNKTIELGESLFGATINFRYDPSPSAVMNTTYTCRITIRTLNESLIGFWFDEQAKLSEVHSDCDNSLRISNNQFNNTYCSALTSYDVHSEVNYLFLDFVSERHNEAYFHMFFYFFHFGSCSDDETSCETFRPNRCVHNGIVCNEPFVCGKDVEDCDETNTVTIVITSVVVSLVVIVIIFVVIFIIHVRVCSGNRTTPLEYQTADTSSEPDDNDGSVRNGRVRGTTQGQTELDQTSLGRNEICISPPPRYDEMFTSGECRRGNTMYPDAPPPYEDVVRNQSVFNIRGT